LDSYLYWGDEFTFLPTLAVFLKVVILILLAGVVILFVSVVRERIFSYKKDKYAKEVKR